MKTIVSDTAPTLVELLREQLDAVSWLRPDLEASASLIGRFLRDEPLTDSEADEADQKLGAFLIDMFLNAREEFLVEDHILHRMAARAFDSESTGVFEQYYAYQMLDELPDVARRAKEVRHLFATSNPRARAAALCREAYRAYIYGLHLASVATLRAVMESSLKEWLGLDLGTHRTLEPLLADAIETKVLPSRFSQLSRKINSTANRALHRGAAPSEKENLQMIGAAQDVLGLLQRYPKPAAEK